MQEGKWEEAAKVFNGSLLKNHRNDPIAYINFGNLLADVR